MSMVSVCRLCGEEKPLAAFYVSCLSACKECYKARVRERARTNPAVQAYNRARAKLPHRKAKADRITREWREANPEKYRAQTAANNAQRDGKLKPKAACEQCGSTFGVHKHHHDYSRPLDVVWLCARCHHRGHADEKRGGAHLAGLE